MLQQVNEDSYEDSEKGWFCLQQPDHWRRTQKFHKFCNILNKFNINLEQEQVNAQGGKMKEVLDHLKGVCSA